jgi:hypothetical protein
MMTLKSISRQSSFYYVQWQDTWHINNPKFTALLTQTVAGSPETGSSLAQAH